MEGRGVGEELGRGGGRRDLQSQITISKGQRGLQLKKGGVSRKGRK
jgi:hypothetical protein